MIAILTEEQAQELTGKQIDDSSYYNPVQINGVWMISEQEVLRSSLEWVKQLELIELETLNTQINEMDS
jgi:hypothetical protein